MKNPKFLTAFLLTGLFAVSSCSAVNTTTANSEDKIAGTEVSTGGGSGAAMPDVDQSIRKVDFKNFTYEPLCAGEQPEKVTVTNGEFSKETREKDSEFVDRFYFGIFGDVTYGDVDGDNKEDAIVLSSCNTGGTGQFSEGFIYTVKTDKPTLLTRIAGGDRAYGGLRSAKFENGLVVVESNDVGEQGGACCPEFVVTNKYKWTGKVLAELSAATKKPLYPEEKVSFAKGATTSTIKVTVDDARRYSLGARAGQTLTVTVDSPDVSVSLIKGEADVTDGNNVMTAKLTSNGNFVIQLQNNAEKPAAVNVTIEIK